jgi:hypothetical protein
VIQVGYRIFTGTVYKIIETYNTAGYAVGEKIYCYAGWCHGITKHTLRLNVVLNKFDKGERRVLSEVRKKRKGLPLPS